MSVKQTTDDQIRAEELLYLGQELPDKFIEPEVEIAGYETIKIELLSPSTEHAYVDWINSAFYSSLCTWDASPQNPVEQMLHTKTLGERESMLLNILDTRPISVALESAVFVFKVTGVPRSMTHQIVRHRQMAFGQQSYRVSSCYSDPVRAPAKVLENPQYAAMYAETVRRCRVLYKQMIEDGIPMEQARNILPMGTCTKIAIEMRLRDMLEYFKGRTSGIAQDEHSYIVALMMKEMRDKQPMFFKFLERKIPSINSVISEYLNV